MDCSRQNGVYRGGVVEGTKVTTCYLIQELQKTTVRSTLVPSCKVTQKKVHVLIQSMHGDAIS